MRFIKQVVWVHSDDRYRITAREKGGFAVVEIFPNEHKKYELTLDAMREFQRDVADVIKVMTGEST